MKPGTWGSINLHMNKPSPPPVADFGARIAPDLPFAYGDRVRFPIVVNEWVSIELHVSTPIPEWNGKTWFARFEETAQITDDGVRWLIPKQKELFLIQPAG